MAEPGARILVAVSGGADSVCLFHVLHDLGYTIEAAHLDHQTRAGASAADAAFVLALCERQGVRLHAESRAVEAEAETSPLSFEEYARNVRYQFLTDVAEHADCAIVATGHHADDQAETVLMRVLRGTSPGGLAGIPPVRMIGSTRIIRPLIDCTHGEILAYLDARGIAHRIDDSNTDTRYLRNRIRHELIPSLTSEYNPRLSEALTRLAEVQRAENELLDEAAAEFLNRCFEAGRIKRDAFARGMIACQRRAIVAVAWRMGVECPFERVEAARAFVVFGPTGRAFDLGGGILLRNARDLTDVVRGPSTTDDREIALACPGDTAAFGVVFRLRFMDRTPEIPLTQYCTASRQVFDADALGEGLSVRFRRPGDRFSPFGMGGTKKVKDYFVDAGVPAIDRDRIPLLVCGERIAWVVGYAIGAEFAVTKHSNRLVKVEVDDATE
jgi:tRNA(Ile)-lysidine synthase